MRSRFSNITLAITKPERKNVNNQETQGITAQAQSGFGSSHCYVAIWDDRHSDTTADVFSTAEKAIEWAKRMARESDRHGELTEELTESMKKAGWLYYACYSCEGDSIRVVRCEVDSATTTAITGWRDSTLISENAGHRHSGAWHGSRTVGLRGSGKRLRGRYTHSISVRRGRASQCPPAGVVYRIIIVA